MKKPAPKRSSRTRSALNAAMAKIKTICWQNTNQPLDVLLIRLNRFLRGWTAHFRYGCSSATFNYLRAYTWKRVFGWLRRKHRHTLGSNSAAATPATDGGPPLGM